MEGDARRISDLYHAALQRPVHDRSSFLIAACNGDAVLQAEVESLLRHESASERFLERGAVNAAARILGNIAGGPPMVGRQLGPYTIVAPLGSGGMGEVYRARDSHLRRDVAIKILRHISPPTRNVAPGSREKRACLPRSIIRTSVRSMVFRRELEWYVGRELRRWLASTSRRASSSMRTHRRRSRSGPSGRGEARELWTLGRHLHVMNSRPDLMTNVARVIAEGLAKPSAARLKRSAPACEVNSAVQTL